MSDSGPAAGVPATRDPPKSWLPVVCWNAWCSMGVYRFTSLAFYLLGASVLGRSGLVPESREMIRTLSVLHEPVFGRAAELLFLFGAFAVPYSTYFVANAGVSR